MVFEEEGLMLGQKVKMFGKHTDGTPYTRIVHQVPAKMVAEQVRGAFRVDEMIEA